MLLCKKKYTSEWYHYLCKKVNLYLLFETRWN